MTTKNTSTNILKANVEALSFGGDGIIKLKDKPVTFLPRTLPGEEVEFEVTKVQKKHQFASLVQILKASNHRIDPKCKYYNNCGGCQLQHAEPAYIRSEKAKQFEQLLKRVGGLEVGPLKFEEKNGSDFDYRNRIRLHVLSNGQLGFQGFNTQGMVTVESCQIAKSPLNEVLLKFQKHPEALKNAYADQVTLWLDTQQKAYALIELTDKAPEKHVSRKSLQKKLKSLFEDAGLEALHVRLKKTKQYPSMVKRLFGPDVMEFKINDLIYNLSPQNFFQTNLDVAGHLSESVTQYFKNNKCEKVLDLHSGVGFFAVHLASQNISVTGVERDASSVEHSTENALNNTLTGRCDFQTNTALQVLQNFETHPQAYDGVVLDPPRSGLEAKLVPSLAKLGPKYIAYVSCNPASFARDAKDICAQGYRLTHVKLFDMFPQTYHFESLAFFEKQ